MRYGITGSKGFLGSSLYFKLKNSKKPNFIFEFDPRYATIPDDLDIIFHLGYSSVIDYTKNNILSLENDIKSAEMIVSYCQEHSCHLIFISSSAVYLDILNKNNYAKSKVKIENLLLDSHNSKFYPLTIARLFNSYGPGQNLNFVIPQIINSLFNRKRLMIHQPYSKRDFIYIEDFTELITDYISNDISPFIFNLKTGNEITIKNLVKLISKKIGIDYKRYIELNNKKYESNLHIDKMIPDISPAFKFKFSLDRGIQKTIDCFISTSIKE